MEQPEQKEGGRMNILIAVPAYGRDYDSAEAVAADWADGKDFRIADVSSRYDGSYVNRADLAGTGTTVKLRYGQLRRFVLIDPDGEVTADLEEE
jgi:hypothetical protein